MREIAVWVLVLNWGKHRHLLLIVVVDGLLLLRLLLLEKATAMDHSVS